MYIARVVGLVVSTIKDEALTGSKLLIVQKADTTGAVVGDLQVAVDTVNAGEGDVVLVAKGSAARQTDRTQDKPVDHLIMGIVDTLQVDSKVTFRKNV